MKYRALFLALALATAATAEPVLLTYGKAAPETTLPVLDLSAKGALESYAAATGLRVGQFPAVADPEAGLWAPVVGGDVAAAEAAIAQAAEARAELQAFYAEDSKTPEQLALEADYFAAVDALYVLAGDPAPTNSAAPSAAEVKAKAKKVKGSKGASKKADDFLDLRNAQLELLELDLALREYDPAWRAKAKRPKE